MTDIQTLPLPPSAFLQPYEAGGAFVDCYGCKAARTVDLPALIQAFYSSPAFWAERQGLKLMNFHPGSRAQVAALAAGDVDTFSAWTVERRDDDQILLCDVKEQTRSWLMVAPAGEGTQLYFGSAIVKKKDASGGEAIPLGFRVLMGFHKVYSRALLASAVKALS